MVANVCCTSHGAPSPGSRSRAMIASNPSMPVTLSVIAPLPPRQGRIAQRDEIAVEDGVALVVAQRPALAVEHATTSALEHALAGGGVPLAGRPEPRIHVHAALGELAEFQRRSQPDTLHLP